MVKAWNGMVSYVTEDGMLGYVLAIGSAPGVASSEKSEVYNLFGGLLFFEKSLFSQEEKYYIVF